MHLLGRVSLAACRSPFLPLPTFTTLASQRPLYSPRLLLSRTSPALTLRKRLSTLETPVLMDQNGASTEARSKRKQPPTSPSTDRPLKQIKPEMDAHTRNGVPKSPELEVVDDAHSVYSLEEPIAPVAGAVHDTAEWQKTIEGVVKSVVSIHFCQTCSFDTDPAISSEATGFVVDAEKGYILTNRHVVGAGPFIGYCIFDNHEECDVYPVYRDPVHDFGILRFDPKAIKYMSVSALQLRPDFAKVGVEIRVVGNDAGEKLSILSGVISRLDRNAPEYGEGYSDFNTNYIQAAAAASGGSSGSPVVNRDGFAVALQAGGRADGAATDYFLPLDRPLRALELVRRGEAVTRGTVQTQWILKPFDECRRLGLSTDLEKAVRTQFPKETGMLVAEVVLPQGPASTKVEEGDILIKVNGEFITQFVRLDSILDDNVGKTISVTIQRAGENLEVELDVGNLHDITPDRFVSVSGASFHDLSYQQARLYAISLKNAGVFVCEAAGSFRFADGYASGWLIQEVDNQPTPNLDTFIEVMKKIPDRKRIVIQYKHLRDLHTANTSITAVDRHWHAKIRIATRNDKTGLWDFKPIADPVPAVPQVSRRANFVKMSSNYPNAVDIVRSFVRVHVSMPIKLDGFPKMNKQGYGLVVDAEQGLVLVSRAILPYDLCDISLIIADSIFIDAKVVFMHPLQNYVIVKYDPALVNAPVKTPKFATEFIRKGDETIFFGLNQNFRPVVAKTVVTDITTVAIPASAITPRYRATNFDAITVDTNQASHSGSGVLIAEDGTVQALWLSYLGERTSHSGKDVEYHLGLATPNLLPILNEIKSGKTPKLRILNVEFQTVQMSQARVMGVSEDWIEKTEQADPERHQLFMVRKVDSGHGGDGMLEGDILLTLNGKLVTRSPDLDVMYNNEFLEAVIVRKREEKTIKVTTVATEEIETDRMVSFCGATLHRPHQAVRQQISKIHSDVYISSRARGSPAYMYGLAPTNFLTHVNNIPTPDLSTFLREVKKIGDNEYFRLKVMTFDNVPWVATMKKNEHYFPTIEYVKDDTEALGWKRIIHECEDGGAREEMAIDNEAGGDEE
ncbi:pro-apoptotic serine protease [Parastagonospora nodorum]|nr:pro-apoptotic serine protease [Parastagonospora nodorum]KAH3967499.1 pro-apoptotic serine protease [Parastagonospora nodorum]KAH4044269.1 pro-apoptotic serine protease [Parastagonospora nodorum]KAH4074441.1 pro-apoptotic serine protease [Parastagonospora nodorum]KAH4096500.1 pro-apoptotic serine protease [Parastagonospora nodorum]